MRSGTASISIERNWPRPCRPRCCFTSVSVAGRMDGKARNRPPTVGPHFPVTRPAARETAPPKTKRMIHPPPHSHRHHKRQPEQVADGEAKTHELSTGRAPLVNPWLGQIVCRTGHLLSMVLFSKLSALRGMRLANLAIRLPSPSIRWATSG